MPVGRDRARIILASSALPAFSPSPPASEIRAVTGRGAGGLSTTRRRIQAPSGQQVGVFAGRQRCLVAAPAWQAWQSPVRGEDWGKRLEAARPSRGSSTYLSAMDLAAGTGLWTNG